MKIYPVNHPKTGGNKFCGPAAISIVTGMDTGQAARLIRTTNRMRKVTGTTDAQMMRALRACGVSMVQHYAGDGKAKERPTMTQWLRDSQKMRTPGRVFLVSAAHHWQIITGRRFCCGVVRDIVSIKDKRANRRGRVKAVYELLVHDKIVIPDEAYEKPSASNLYDKTCRERLKRAEKEHGVKGRLESNSGVQDYVIDPCPLFPRGFSIVHYNWPETFEKFDFFANDYSAYDDSADEDGHISF